MDYSRRVVERIPLDHVWDSHGVLPLVRTRLLGREQIAELLRHGPVQFIVANCLWTLRWVPFSKMHEFWKSEVKPRLIEPEAAEHGFQLGEYPGEYCYVASEWRSEDASVVLLEMYH